MKRIDAHAHIGYTGGWANVGITGEELIAQMDQQVVKRSRLVNLAVEEVKLQKKLAAAQATKQTKSSTASETAE